MQSQLVALTAFLLFVTVLNYYWPQIRLSKRNQSVSFESKTLLPQANTAFYISLNRLLNDEFTILINIDLAELQSVRKVKHNPSTVIDFVIVNKVSGDIVSCILLSAPKDIEDQVLSNQINDTELLSLEGISTFFIPLQSSYSEQFISENLVCTACSPT